MKHITVLLNESIEQLNIKENGIYVDGTLGGGGHSELLLNNLKGGHLYAFDQDTFAIDKASKRLESFNNKTIRLVHGSTRLINEYLKENSNEAKEVMEELTEDILICGHTHIPYVKYYGEKLLVNAGSVGKPKTNNPNTSLKILNNMVFNFFLFILYLQYYRTMI